MTSQAGFHELELHMQSARIFTVYTYCPPNVSKIIYVLPSRIPRSTLLDELQLYNGKKL